MKKLWQTHRILCITGISLVLAGLFSYALYRAGHWPGQKSFYAFGNVVVVPVSKMDKPVAIQFSGTIEGHKAATVSADSLGQVKEVNVKEGDLVKAGQVLLTIETTPRTIAVASSASSYSSGQRTATDAPSAGSGQYASLEKEYQRYQKLYDQGAIAKKKLDEVRARLEAAQAGASESDTSAAPAAASDPEQTVTTQMVGGGLVKITAPTDGIVTGFALTVGNTVQTGQQLLTLSNGTGVQTVVQLSQKDLYFVRSGSKADIQCEALPGQTFSAQVESIFPGANQLFRTQIRIDNPNDLLKPGMPVTARFYTTQTVPVLAVPKTAVFEEKGLSYIYVAKSGKAAKQEVQLGDPVGDFVEIVTALPEQTLVATGNIKDLKEGDSLPVQ